MTRRWTNAITATAVIVFSTAHSTATGQVASSSKPNVITIDQLRELEKFRDQTVQISVVARHIGSERMFTIGKSEGREIPVLLLNPSIDTANLGDALTITGTVRRFDAATFARDYSTFKATDYTTVPTGALVIVASSIRGPEGGQVSPVAPPK